MIAHEIGHHVQNQLGISDKVDRMRQRAGEAEGNQLSVRLELQADCFAGIWANHADRSRHVLESGDIEEGLNAATAIGDDTLQRQTRGTVVPESFTHGSSAQRVRWFKRGVETGDLRQCDTFAAQAALTSGRNPVLAEPTARYPFERIGRRCASERKLRGELRERLDHLGRCLHQFDQHAFAADRKLLVGLGMQKGDVVAGSAAADTARREAHALRS